MTMTSEELSTSLTPFEFAPGRKASWSTLKSVLPDIQTALFFAKAFDLDYKALSALMYGLFQSPLMAAMSSGQHSVDLQDYLVDTFPEDVWPEDMSESFTAPPAIGQFLPELWDAIDLVVARSIKDVAAKLGTVLDALPSKEGQIAFQHLAKLNRQRPTIGTYTARFHHAPVQETLVVLDVSGSMTAGTIAAIVADVVALSWKANASLAIVSSHTFVWSPGTYSVDDVLAKAEYMGTQYETLLPLFDQDWGTVITIADYDSSYSAKETLSLARGRIGKVLDISLVNRPTYLAEVLGQLADDVEPLLIANSSYPICD